MEAAKRAFMACIAVPYLQGDPLGRRFAMADLLFDGGMAEFRAEAALRFIGCDQGPLPQDRPPPLANQS